ncbi:MAG: hypothetical protein IT488_08790 [Gammaproteobacteria bacterium]|nr:hypothetical protein [Gammaproteobacteria bacterium]
MAETATPAYAPAGSPPPAAPCARAKPVVEMDFLCRFLTQELWEQAGRPEFIDAGGRRWQAWFYGRDGVTNQLLVEGRDYLPDHEGWFEALLDAGNFEAQTYEYFWDLLRYAPWSVQFHAAAECRDVEVLNPATLASARFRRMHVLGLGWPGLDPDPGDPARTFGPAALPLLSGLVNLRHALEPPLRARFADAGSVRAEVSALAAGRGALWPDFARDGGVWEIDRNGAATSVDDLDEAARRLTAHGLLVTNDAMRSWASAQAVAAEIARERGPLLFIYFAQDAFLPIDDDGVYGWRLRYLLGAVERASEGKTSVRVLSHGRSTGVVARALADHPAINHESYAPMTSSLDADEYASTLRQAVADGRIDITAPGLPVTMGEGVAAPECLDWSDLGIGLKTE